ncbi:hypothetical protein CASFOL_038109 [Castilleja foliolosa]|uniref:Uncharacterized protein n=1 Tax=Castilleja foliolosa TaxID=1961234 RepID=A0ABD3BK18_9LAMI
MGRQRRRRIWSSGSRAVYLELGPSFRRRDTEAGLERRTSVTAATENGLGRRLRSGGASFGFFSDGGGVRMEDGGGLGGLWRVLGKVIGVSWRECLPPNSLSTAEDYGWSSVIAEDYGLSSVIAEDYGWSSVIS